MSERILRSVYSLATQQWLRWDGLGWTDETVLAGAWGAKAAAEKAANVPADTRAMVREPPEGD